MASLLLVVRPGAPSSALAPPQNTPCFGHEMKLLLLWKLQSCPMRFIGFVSARLAKGVTLAVRAAGKGPVRILASSPDGRICFRLL